VKTGHGGIRDVEFTIQFLQLLNGGYLPDIRTPNTLEALEKLQATGCLTNQERHLLEDTYRFLRKIEHRLQTMFDLQTHRMPSETAEVRKLALRMGYQDRSDQSAEKGFRDDYRRKTRMNRRILDHLLHDAFPHDSLGQPEPEVDLVFDPDPGDETIEQVLGRYPFKDVKAAYANLNQLSRESIPFLSTPRCRHFLASIAPRLLRAVAATPDPDLALVNLERVSASLGGKGVLWELFSFSPPTLRLYVDLCASSQFLSEILVTHPGMIDELMDSLVLNQPRELDELRGELNDLCRGAEDPEPILHSFKNKELLRIGVRDILGKDSLEGTIHALSDVAQVVLEAVCRLQYAVLVEKLGTPTVSEGPRAGRPSRSAVLALGKFGGRELSYHSDLDVVFLYEAVGRTAADRAAGAGTSNFDFYSQWAQRVINAMGRMGPYGRLYAIDARLRPTGRSGSLAIPLDEFRRYYAEGAGQLWERQALTKARVAVADEAFAPTVIQAVEQAAYGHPWRPSMAEEIQTMRERLEASTPTGNLKRGAGGIVDVEFLTQMLLLKFGPRCPAVRCTGTLDALDRLARQGSLATARQRLLRESYVFLRTVEGRLRLAYDVTRDDLPSDPDELEKLALRLGYHASDRQSAGNTFLEELSGNTKRTRRVFREMLAEESDPEKRADPADPID
jgi:glutamate-ammonia-ligase adenylyltransferase